MLFSSAMKKRKERKNSRLIIPLETATAWASKATGICERIVRNDEKSEVVVPKPDKFGVQENIFCGCFYKYLCTETFDNTLN
jgi:hypothetical protein